MHTEAVWYRLNLRRLCSENRASRRTCCVYVRRARRVLKLHTSAKFNKTFDLVEQQWSEFKVVEFRQPTSHSNIGTPSVCSSLRGEQNLKQELHIFAGLCLCSSTDNV